MKHLCLFCLALLALPAFANPFVAVFIDAATEAKLGKFPIDRTYYAQAAVVLKEAQARGIVFKYFFDLPRKGDEELALAMKGIPTLLQARIDHEEPASKTLAAKFFRPTQGKQTALIAGKRGWIPIPTLQRDAHGVGFVDARQGQPLSYPAFESYQGKTVPSLVLLSVEMALNEKATAELGENLKFPQRTLALSPQSEFTIKAKSTMKIYSFKDLLDKSIPAAELKEKIVILGYSGSKAQTFQTSLGPIGAHELFLAAAEDLYQRVVASGKQPPSL